MQPSYLTFSAKALLDMFGAGKHIPGAGSAAAHSGLLAAQLVLTVCKLTITKETFQAHHQSLAEISKRIESVSIPELERLLDADAAAFNLVHAERIAQKNAPDPLQQRLHRDAENRLMKSAVVIPLEIAAICMEIVDYAENVFDVGLPYVRGDSGVALCSAVSSVLSCIFIVNLNLKKFTQNHWTIQRRAECDQLQRKAIVKQQAAQNRLRNLRAEAMLVQQGTQGVTSVLTFGARAKTSYSNEEIEDRARKLGREMWLRKDEIWRDRNVLSDPIQILDPEKALGTLGYSFELVDTLGTIIHGSTAFEVAGILEAQPGHVRVSKQMPSEIRLFTAAHELGHVILHPHLKEAHRDRPLDGSIVAREQVEREADRFAAAFLMPAKLVRGRFSAVFGMPPFTLNESTAYALGMDVQSTREKIKTSRDLSMLLAGTGRYNGKHVISLAKQFRVSVTTMAIRLEELHLVDPELF